MIVRKKIKKRASFRKRKILLLLAVCAASCLFALFLLNRAGDNTVGKWPAAGTAGKFVQQAGEASETEREVRAVFPYSVIPGGVQNREELADRIARDRVVSDHYRDFKVSDARVVKADKARMMYVSYRMDDQVYWTKKKIRIPEGEALITDGECEARTRCGNMVSASPQEPVSDEEPMIETFDFPRVVKGFSPDDYFPPAKGFSPNDYIPPAGGIPPDNFSQLTKSMPPKLNSLPTTNLEWDPLIPTYPTYPAYPISVPQRGMSPGYNPSILPTGPSDIVAPEPATITLMVTGLAAFFAFRFLRKK